MLRANLVLAAYAAASLVAPGHADDPEWAGFTCGFTSTNDPTGLVEQDPNVQTGEMDCGPVVAADVLNDDASGPSSNPALGEITIVGTIQVNQHNYGGAPAARASCQATGTGVAYGACVISYSALPTDNVYLCTAIWIWVDGNYVHFYYDEDDNPANGYQCGLAISAGA